MILYSMFDNVAKQGIIDRIEKLSPSAQRQWGKMDVAQMLAHCQCPIGVATGDYQLKRTLLGTLMGPMFKGMMSSNKPFKKGLPTDKSFIVSNSRNFEEEKTKLVHLIKKFDPKSLVNEVHPFFGKLSKEAWGTGNWKHLDHHLQQFGV